MDFTPCPGPYEKPNVIQLRAINWTTVTVHAPSLVVPISVLTGYLLAYPNMRAALPAPASSAGPTLNLDALIYPGGAGCFLPCAGLWSIYNSGNDTPTVMIVEASHPLAPMILNCAEGTHAVTTHTTATMTVASATVLAGNWRATYRMVINDGTVPVYLSLAAGGAAAVANQGIRLNANGGSYEMSKKAGNLYKGIITGITASGTATVLVTEGGIPIPT